MPNSPFSSRSSSTFRSHAPRLSVHRHLVLLALALAALGCGGSSEREAVAETLALRQENERLRSALADTDGALPLAAPGEAPLVEVFVTDWCPYCQRLEAFLKQNGVAYQRKNIEQSAEARAEHEELGGGGIPVTRINGREVIRGFRPDVIGKALGLESTEGQSSAARRSRPSASLSPSRKASAASCLLSPMSVTRTS